MSQISIGKLFAKALKKEGIDAIFTLSGGHIMPILYACLLYTSDAADDGPPV